MCIKVNQYKCFMKREDRRYFVKNAEYTFFLGKPERSLVRKHHCIRRLEQPGDELWMSVQKQLPLSNILTENFLQHFKQKC